MLVVWEFNNFLLPAVIISPIPLTLVGIVPGHWIMGAEFTATSMIGFIALAGIIVRNSILLVDYSRQEISLGVEVKEAIIMACITRTRPIVITALALVVGSTAILLDPIFQGMAVSLMFGVFVSTILTLVVIPLGCYSGRASFCQNMREDHPDYYLCSDKSDEEKTVDKKGSYLSFLMMVLGSVFNIIVTVVQIVWWSLQGVYTMLFGSKKTAEVTTKTTVKETSKVTTSSAASSDDTQKETSQKETSSNKLADDMPVVLTHSAVVEEKKSSAIVKKEKAAVSESEVAKVQEKTEATPKPTSAPVKKKTIVKKKVVSKKKSVSLNQQAGKKQVVKKVVKKKSRRGIQLKGDLDE